MSDSFAPSGLLREVREHVEQVSAGVADPSAVGRDPEELLRDEQAQQFGVVQGGFATGVVLAGDSHRGQDPVIEMNVQCGQEGVEVSIHTRGLTPSANDLGN